MGVELITEGAQALAKWLEDERRSQEWLAKQLGVAQSSVGLWLKGGGLSVKHALRLKDVTRIAVEAWGRDAKPFRPPKARARATRESRRTGTES